VDRVDILGISFHRTTLQEAVSAACSAKEEGHPFLICTPNPEIVEIAHEDKDLRTILNQADLVVPDGIGIVIASRILGRSLPERVAGIDLALRLLEVGGQKGWRVYLLGTDDDTVAEAAGALTRDFPGLLVAGYHHGYFSPGEAYAVSAAVRDASPDLVLVGMGSPRQEYWLRDYGRFVGPCIVQTVGGSLDVFAGKVKRAPSWVKRLGMEWFYRLLLDPKRIGRQIRLLSFAARVLVERFKM
jgi:N-acetylglucosaminyldiphosphoundecaprenol N-acetyl-beta-D-mannosaminyltransferase